LFRIFLKRKSKLSSHFPHMCCKVKGNISASAGSTRIRMNTSQTSRMISKDASFLPIGAFLRALYSKSNSVFFGYSSD
jgi:hypothetical protein